MKIGAKGARPSKLQDVIVRFHFLVAVTKYSTRISIREGLSWLQLKDIL